MDYPTAASLALYSLAQSITPGPNNIMLASSGSFFGFRRTVPHMIGVTFGATVMFVLAGVGLGTVFEEYPVLRTGLKIFGAGYLLYLAWKLWSAAGTLGTSAGRPFGFWQAAGFQFVNPKAWLIVLPALAAFIDPSAPMVSELALLCVIFALVNLPSVASWALLGAGVRVLLSKEENLRLFNRIMAALTAATAVLLLM